MKLLARNVALLSVLPWLVFAFYANLFTARPTHAQGCENLQGNLDVMPGDLAHLGAVPGQSVQLLPGMRSRSKALYSGAPGELVLVRSASIAYDTCYRWLYVEVEDSGTEGWIRSDNVGTSQLNIRPPCEDVTFARGDVAQLYSYREMPNQPVKLRSGAGFSVKALHSVASGEVVSIQSTAVHSDTCYQWLYVEVKGSGVKGWVRADNVKANRGQE